MLLPELSNRVPALHEVLSGSGVPQVREAGQVAIDGGVPGLAAASADELLNLPLGDPVEGDVACLILDTGHGRRATFELQGTYYLPFMMTLQTFTGFDNNGDPADVASCN